MKSKKLTKKDQESQLIEWLGRFKEKIQNEYMGFDMVHTQNYVHNNINMARCYCTHCKTEWDLSERHVQLRYQTIKCPHCGTSTTDNFNHEMIHMEKHDNGWYMVHYAFTYNRPYTDNSDIFAWMKSDTMYNLKVYEAIRYEQDNDVVLFQEFQKHHWYPSNVSKMHKRGSQTFNQLINGITSFCDKNPDNEEYAVAIRGALHNVETAKAEAKAARAPSKSEVLVDKQMCYQPNEDGIDRVKDAYMTFVVAMVSQYGSNTKYAVTCSSCGHYDFFTASSPQIAVNLFGGEDMICPKCGKHAVPSAYATYSYYRGDHTTTDMFLYEKTNLPHQDLLLRIFDATSVIKLVTQPDNSVKPVVTTEIKEVTRFFFGPKINMFGYDEDTKVWRKERSEMRYYTRNSYRHDTRSCANSDDDLMDVISNSYLRYSGFKEAIGLDKRYKTLASPTDLSYIAAWYRNPAIEHVYKSQLYTLTEEVLTNRIRNGFTMEKGKDVYETLDLTPMELKIARQCSLGSYDIHDMRSYCRQDPTITVDGYKALTAKVHISSALQIAEHGIRWKDIVDYVDTVLLHQCIRPNETMLVWKDYLNMAREIGYNLRERSRKFPSSLRKEHDIAMFAHESIKREIDEKKFSEHALKNAELYEYSLDNLVAVVPRTVAQVVEEATNQHNCLASYVNRLIRGDTAVVFVRHKDAPDTSYVTCEIRDGAFEQIKGFANSNPKTPELDNFIRKWAHAKKLVVKHW